MNSPPLENDGNSNKQACVSTKQPIHRELDNDDERDSIAWYFYCHPGATAMAVGRMPSLRARAECVMLSTYMIQLNRGERDCS